MMEKQQVSAPRGQAEIRKMVLAALLLALGLVLPFVTGQIPEIGNMLLPMHLPVLLCGFICGPAWAAVVGAVAPLLRFMLFGMPPLFPVGVAMCVELATYGAVSGALYRLLPRKAVNVYVSLIAAMLAGRLVWALASLLIYRLFADFPFTFQLFVAGGFLSAWPGMILQIVLVPLLERLLEKSRMIPA